MRGPLSSVLERRRALLSLSISRLDIFLLDEFGSRRSCFGEGQREGGGLWVLMFAPGDGLEGGLCEAER
jgi:hypothetical protein